MGLPPSLRSAAGRGRAVQGSASLPCCAPAPNVAALPIPQLLLPPPQFLPIQTALRCPAAPPKGATGPLPNSTARPSPCVSPHPPAPHCCTPGPGLHPPHGHTRCSRDTRCQPDACPPHRRRATWPTHHPRPPRQAARRPRPTPRPGASRRFHSLHSLRDAALRSFVAPLLCAPHSLCLLRSTRSSRCRASPPLSPPHRFDCFSRYQRVNPTASPPHRSQAAPGQKRPHAACPRPRASAPAPAAAA